MAPPSISVKKRKSRDLDADDAANLPLGKGLNGDSGAAGAIEERVKQLAVGTGSDFGEESELDSIDFVNDEAEEEDEEDEEDEDEDEDEDDNDLAYMSDDNDDSEKQNGSYTVTTDANGNLRYLYPEIDPHYDSDDSDAKEQTNTIGNIPLSYYERYPHIGYDINGKRIARPAKGEALDSLLDSIEVPAGWTGLTDPQTGKPLQLSRDELEILKRITRNEAPADGYDPYPDMVEYFTSKEEVMPLSAAPEPKRRFIPSKHESQRVLKIVKAIKEGRIKPWQPPKEREDEERDYQTYDLWADEAPRPDNPMHMPAPKLPPPGYEESYHPPPEYLPDAAEKKAWEEEDPEDRDKEYLPEDHDALRKVKGYGNYVKEKFERCLDLYLAPRLRRTRREIDPEQLLPQLPNPDELRPFPTHCVTTFDGHAGRIRSLSIDPSGEWLATGGDDHTVRIWELSTGYELQRIKLPGDEAVDAVAWRPATDAVVLAVATGDCVYFIVPPGLADNEKESASISAVKAGFALPTEDSTAGKPKSATWSRSPSEKLEAAGVHLTLRLASSHPIKALTWHRRGNHLATTCPSSSSTSRSIAIHTLDTHKTQHPFRRLRGLAQTTAFHPSQPLFYVVTQRSVRIYDLQRAQLIQQLLPGSKWLSSIAVHPTGRHLLLGSYDRRTCWHDLELDPKHPWKTLRYHDKAIRSVAFHERRPLMATAGDDGAIHVLHQLVVGDGMEEPRIVPLKVLRRGERPAHDVVQSLGVMDVQWHPREAWCVSVGADGVGRLWM